MSALSILAEECELLNDNKYRSYITQVEKALKNFEYTSEWADLIAALGKLNKVLLAHVKYPVIPKRVTIGKRLAQCLHPALPSGVHLKALETYDIIFRCIGTQRLAQDLFIYSAGLFPLLGHSAMNVKPVLLMIYEKHFLGLGKQIKPGLNGLLLGLLPGLEEGSEFYDRTNSLLDEFCQATEPAYFYTCMWECVHSCPSVRLPAITFLLSHYNKKQSMEDQLYMMGLNINLMVDGICNAIQDSSVLVQRCLLDFLLLAFPLHNSQLTHSDMAKVVKTAITVLLRRDMSLNRRFYGWLLGTTGTAAVHIAESTRLYRGDKSAAGVEAEFSYFHTYSKELLVQALKSKLSEKTDMTSGVTVKNAVLKPFRILISLLDKPEIGPVILENVLLSIFRCLYREFEKSKHSSTEEGSKKTKLDGAEKSSIYNELLKTANLLFGTFEPYFIWEYTARMFEQSCKSIRQRSKRELSNPESQRSRHSSSTSETQELPRKHARLSRQGSTSESPEVPSVPELCQLIMFLMDVITLETFMEVQTEHLPLLLNQIITSLTTHSDILKDAEIICSLQLCTKILSKVQPSMTTAASHSQPPVAEVHPDQSTPVEAAPPMSLEDAMEMNRRLKEKVDEEQEKEEGTDTNCSEKALETDSSMYESLDSTNGTEDSVYHSPNGSQHGANDNSKMVTEKSTNQSLKSAGQSVETELERSKVWLSKRSDNTANLMQTCIESFQTFLHSLISLKFVTKPEMSAKCVESITLSSDRVHCSDKDSCLDSVSVGSFTDGAPEDRVLSSELKISMKDCDETCLETFTSACHLLVEFASFPVYCSDVERFTSASNPDCAGDSLPTWIQDLITCCCFVDNFHIQSSAISTVLDLVILTQSVQEHKEKSTEAGDQSSTKLSSLVVMPTLHPWHLKYISDHTEFYKAAALILWGYLGESTPRYHQQAVKLFNILHQVAPSSWICENVIGRGLVSESEKQRIDSFKKFTVLWHLTRNRKTEVIPGKPLRTYDRSMLVVLDSLKEESSPVKVIANTWLTHVIQHGDISRVMEPLMLMLLHPDTARVSVQHVNIHKPRKVLLSESSEEDPAEANIYAISSDGGNIIYHVSAAKEFSNKNKAEEIKSYALTVLNDRGASTAPARSSSHQEFHFDKVDPSEVSLKINPFGSESSLDKLIFDGYETPQPLQHSMLNKAKRLNKETCHKEGISFSESDDARAFVVEETDSQPETDVDAQNNTDCESVESSVEDVVSGILDDLFKAVIQRGEPGSADEPGARNTPTARTAGKLSLANRTVSVSSSNAGDQDLLNSVNKQGARIDSPTPSEMETSLFQDAGQDETDTTTDIHTLHMHILLYTQKYDCERTLYALSTIKSMLVSCPRLLVTSLTTTSISAMRTPQLAKLQLLLARHRKSVFGKNFFGEITPDVMSNYRSSMFIEVLISLCFYYVRSYYPNLMMSKLSHAELLGNKEVHILATETLTLLVSEVIGLMRDSGKNFVSYISDLLQRCKVQKALLHCILSVIYNGRKKKEQETAVKITEVIIAFNEENLVSSANETFQIKLLNFLLVLIMLEEQIHTIHGNQGDASTTNEWDRLRVSHLPSLLNVRYNLGHPIVQQGMFLSSVLSALKQFHMCHMHRHWVALVTTALPYMGRYLPGIVLSVVSQLCRNLEAIAMEYEANGKKSVTSLEKVPPDHAVTMLNGLMTICHYCLLDNISPVSIGQASPSAANVGMDTANTTNILSNLFHVFNPVGGSREASPQRELGAMSPVLDARASLLSILPRIIACMTSLWRAVKVTEKQEENPAFIMGMTKVVRQDILEFLSPISLPHGTNLLGAIAVAWNDRRRKNAPKAPKKVTVARCEDQLLLVDLVSAIKVLPMDTLIQTVKHVLRQPPPSELGRKKRAVPLEVNLLQFFFAYVERTPASQLTDSWSSLLSLLREGLQLQLTANGQFLLLQILNEFVQKTPPMADKKNQKEVQEISQRLLEAVAVIAGSSLEQTTWLRRNYAVKPGPQSDTADQDDSIIEEEEAVTVEERRVVEPDPTVNVIESKYSVQALSLLAELMAPLLDVVYSSEEKDRVAQFLTTILYSVFPYLKHHSFNNLPSMRACSQLLSSISSYQYTRKSWRKEGLELLLEPSFFQTDVVCIQHWHVIVDNLMTHDKTTYKDLLARVSMAQTGSLNLFSNKEQEIDQKAALLKRLAFVIFCSDPDQYQKSIPEIQERLAESLRVPQAPSVMAQVFLCFRVLMLRISPQHLTSMWPTIITELIHVFLQMEQELSSETDEFVTQVQRIAALDSSWAHLGNGLNAHNNPYWLQLYLSACKLLDLCLALPADRVPQFQLYRWAFIGGAAAGEVEEPSPQEKKKRSQQPTFKPHIIRLAKLLNSKLQGDVPVMKLTPGRPLLTFTYLRSLTEMQPFFNTLCLASQTDNIHLAAMQLGGNISGSKVTSQVNGHSGTRERKISSHGNMPKSKSTPVLGEVSNQHLDLHGGGPEKSDRQYIEELIEKDFLEPFP